MTSTHRLRIPTLLLAAALAACASSSDTKPPEPAKGPPKVIDPASAAGLPKEPRTMPTFFDATVPGPDGKPVPLSKYRGKALLVVNVASQCGFTPQYEGLQWLRDDLAHRGFEVLGFPSNEFGGQEPGTAEEIRQFCESKYRISFPLFAKTEVKKGAGQSPAYAYLTETSGREPNWNFCKYVVDRQGRVTQFFASRTRPDDPKLREAIQAALAE